MISRLMLNLRDPKLSRAQAKNVSTWADGSANELPGWNRRYDLPDVMVTTAIGTGYLVENSLDTTRSDV